MQPAETGFDWSHGVTGILGAVFGAASGFVASIWRVARIEPTIRADFEAGISAAEQRVEDKIDESNKECETRLESLVSQFHEAFSGMRQKINDVELDTERRFLSKDSFDDFRNEYREDMKRIFGKLDNIPGRRQ